ncbi:MAG: uridine kinase [Bacilli bacterium]|nr:uridine kinase [Bacilli bacterium]
MPYIIALNGPSCAGKTYISNIIKNIDPNRISILSYDSYCVDHGDLSIEEIKKINYDIPSSYDGELLTKHINDLKNNKSINCPIYNFAKHRRSEKTNIFHPNDIIIVEGIMVFQVEQLLKDGYDLKVFVKAKEDTRYERRFKRDQIERGRSPESIIYQWNTTVQPSCEIYIEPLIKYADIVLENDINNGEIKNIDLLINKVKELLKNEKL